jgi:prepilin-type N-terminal cleavage/methylation domain-containing protein
MPLIPTRRCWRGVTLIEVTVVMALVGIVGAAIGTTLIRQQRFYRGASELLYARGSVRDALEVLSTDIRGLAVADTVRLMADSAMEFFAGIGTSVVCQATNGIDVGLPGASGPRGNTLTSLLAEPDSGDLAVFYRAGADSTAGTWERRRLSSFSPRSAASACSDASALGSGSGSAFVATLGSALPIDIGRGAPVRFVRRGRYSLYRASDGAWYLGYRRCDAAGLSRCGGIQPLSGPYRPYSSNPLRTGLLFEYFDAGGLRLGVGSSPLSLARVDITARAESGQEVPVESRVIRPADSASLSIAVRNRTP